MDGNGRREMKRAKGGRKKCNNRNKVDGRGDKREEVRREAGKGRRGEEMGVGVWGMRDLRRWA